MELASYLTVYTFLFSIKSRRVTQKQSNFIVYTGNFVPWKNIHSGCFEKRVLRGRFGYKREEVAGD
jgi:hypothetical protein